jgi:benzoyl-CoA reductase/2-hydroxyglutaryl-CoA dehydratase subunit BcrC/BadD/HgdB
VNDKAKLCIPISNEIVNEKFITSLMKIPFIYPLEFVLKNIYNKPISTWLKFTFDRFRKAHRKEKPIVWSNGFIAQEFLYGLDFIPIFPEVIVGFFSYLGFGGKLIKTAEKKYSSDLCSFYKAGIGMIEEDLLPHPDFIISTSHICNGAVKFFELASKFYNCPFYLINVPYEKNKETIKFVSNRLKDTKKALNATDEKLEQSIYYSNQSRKYMEKINNLRKDTCPMHGDESLGYMLAMYFSCWGSEQGMLFYKSLFKELKKRKPKEENFRLLWLHHVRLYYKNNIMDLLKQKKAIVVMDESSYLWEELDEKNPYHSMAEKILSHPYGIVENRIDIIKKMVKEYNIDGAIHFSQWGCRQSSGSAIMVKKILNEMDIPTLIINGDAIDERSYEPEQLKTRINAFLELLEEKCLPRV